MSHVIFPAGPDDAADLARVHVTAWRETYEGLLPSAYLQRMSVPAHAYRFQQALLHASPFEATLIAADRYGVVGYASGGPSRARREGEAEIATLYLLRSAQGRGLGHQLGHPGADQASDQRMT